MKRSSSGEITTTKRQKSGPFVELIGEQHLEDEVLYEYGPCYPAEHGFMLRNRDVMYFEVPDVFDQRSVMILTVGHRASDKGYCPISYEVNQIVKCQGVKQKYLIVRNDFPLRRSPIDPHTGFAKFALRMHMFRSQNAVGTNTRVHILLYTPKPVKFFFFFL